MGGRVGLKGTDGVEIVEQAKRLGAKSLSPLRAMQALGRLAAIQREYDLLTYPNEMGEDEARECGLSPLVIGSIQQGHTSSRDTRTAAKEMRDRHIDLLLFAGGDGTARDIYDSIGSEVPVLGIPSGVKMHSAVYATSPENAGDLAGMYLSGPSSRISLRQMEVMDIDECAVRENRLSARLYGYLTVPFERTMVQSAKAGSAPDDAVYIVDIASSVIRDMQDDYLYVIGPGTTAKAVMTFLGLQGTLLGVDTIKARRVVGRDVNEAQLLRLTEGERTKIVVGVIGAQGYIFGRGNQQISADVIRRIGKDNVIVVATLNKIASLPQRALLVDTGDRAVNDSLCGYIQVVIGLDQRLVVRVMV
jgi:predicted polyphosphate/ATP-dependent NAD kinase